MGEPAEQESRSDKVNRQRARAGKRDGEDRRYAEGGVFDQIYKN